MWNGSGGDISDHAGLDIEGDVEYRLVKGNSMDERQALVLLLIPDALSPAQIQA